MTRWYVVALGILACDRAPEKSTPTPTPTPTPSATTITTATATASASAPDKDKSCDFARTALAELASTFPTKCMRDADCDGYYIGASACDPAIVLAKPGVPDASKARLEELQASARASCLAQAACSPKPFRAVCRAGRCADAAR